ncbi:serine O-acetyltransferase [Sphingomonas sp. SRS2]|uniref:serine O-acetyltransferase n=1 Tax=Sphingomonas sp. SRS2 TaxID=133190 RepID=UPI0009FCFA38|nr:serine O-acetyltransferase [Sphingomonas sp. SRS2]
MTEHQPRLDQVSLWDLIKEDHRTHYSDWTRPGFRAMAVYRFGHWALRRRSYTLKLVLSVIHRTAFRFVRNVYGIEIRPTATVGRRFHIGHQGAIVVHAHAVIGDDCLIRQGATLGIGGLERGTDFEESGPIIGNRVDIGAGAMIVGRLTIGDDVNIGPNAVVLVNVPSNSTVLPPPARILPRPPQNAALQTSTATTAGAISAAILSSGFFLRATDYLPGIYA